jgi:hypothetical protein
MSDRTCSVADCHRPAFCKTYCRAHYARHRLSGDVRADVPLRHMPTRAERGDIAGRILARCEVTASGCIEWHGHRNLQGYGSICWDSTDWPVHRAMWTAVRGPIPTDDDWTIDHLCRNKSCVNVEHLEVVTRWENARRGGGLERAHQANRDKQACKHGHPFTPDNVWWTGEGHRICKACKRKARERQAG